jgi:hypothetical protein
MKNRLKLSTGFICVLLVTLCQGGSLNPPAPPTAGTMKPLNDVEPRVAIHQSDMPLTISASGSYYLTQNVTSAANGITVNADDVTIDLNGFVITGPGAGSNSGILINGRNNVEIRNGTVRGFSRGIYDGYATGESYRVLGVRAVANSTAGIYFTGTNNQIRDCTVSSTGVSAANISIYGIYTGAGSTVANNTVTRTGHQATATSFIFCIMTNTGCIVTNNTVYNNGTSAAGYVYGISVSSGCTLTGNNVHNNGTSATVGVVFGIYATNAGNTITGNTVYSNGSSAAVNVTGIYATNGNTVSGNTANNNGTSSTGTSVTGIFAGSGSAVIGNTACSNGGPAAGTVYGLNLGGNNFVSNNSSYLNTGTGGGANMYTPTPSNCVFGPNLAP